MSNEDIIEMEAMQEDMHKTIEWMMNRNPKLKYQDCVTTYLLLKISQMGVSIKRQFYISELDKKS